MEEQKSRLKEAASLFLKHSFTESDSYDEQ